MMTKGSTLDQLRRYSHVASKEQARTEAIFSSMGTGAITTDEHGRIDRVNSKALELLGFSKKDLLGKWFPQVIVARDDSLDLVDPLDRPIAQAFLTGKPINTRTHYQKKDGSLLPVNITVSPIIMDGKPVGAVEVFDDISKELEVDKMKSDFISLASHQLRTPLTAIGFYTQMLLDGYNGDINTKQSDSLKTVIKSVKRMNKLISALLDISKLETGKLTTKNTYIDLKILLDGILSDLKQEAIKKEIELSSNFDGENFEVNSDALLIGEIYSNLISNAIKYTPNKGKVDISLEAKKSNYVFCVADNGYGIPLDFQDKMFIKFPRAENAQLVDTTGTGLGLYLVKEITKILNGKLWFESEENKGTKFYFSLPGKYSS